jgi:hypothetical protein
MLKTPLILHSPPFSTTNVVGAKKPPGQRLPTSGLPERDYRCLAMAQSGLDRAEYGEFTFVVEHGSLQSLSKPLSSKRAAR